MKFLLAVALLMLVGCGEDQVGVRPSFYPDGGDQASRPNPSNPRGRTKTSPFSEATNLRGRAITKIMMLSEQVRGSLTAQDNAFVETNQCIQLQADPGQGANIVISPSACEGTARATGQTLQTDVKTTADIFRGSSRKIFLEGKEIGTFTPGRGGYIIQTLCSAGECTFEMSEGRIQAIR